MLNIRQGYSSHQDTVEAAKEIIKQILQQSTNYVIFFAGNHYDFEVLTTKL